LLSKTRKKRSAPVTSLQYNTAPYMPEAASEDLRESRRSTTWDSGTQQAFFAGGIVLLASSANILIFSAFPLQIMRPEWQLRVASVLLTSGVSALIGVLLLVLAQQNSPKKSSPMLARVRFIRQLAGWAAIGYLILIPGQIAAGLRLLSNTANAEKQPRIEWGKFRSRIQATETEAQLRELLGSRPDIPPLPEKLDVPLNRLKEELITYTDSRFAARDTEIEKARSERLQNFLNEALRNTIQSLLLAWGFSAVAKKGSRFGPLGASSEDFSR
jgi:hypothetical protein